MIRNSQQFKFEWAGGHPALDFVNTLDERISPHPIELLENYHSLLFFTSMIGRLDKNLVPTFVTSVNDKTGRSILEETILLREQLNDFLLTFWVQKIISQKQLESFQAKFIEVKRKRILTSTNYHITWTWLEPLAPRRPLEEIILSIEDLFLGNNFAHLKQCAADDCGVWFLDQSRSGTRRWCSMANCGNRAKVRRFRKTHK
jgi:predicted RNA-binding Zn ribbon-like protein